MYQGLWLGSTHLKATATGQKEGEKGEQSECLYVLFLINLGACCRGAAQIWKNWELSSGVHDVKFPKSQ